MQENFCDSCASTREEGHRCYENVDKEYLLNNILTEVYIQCGVCGRRAYLSAVFEESGGKGWIRKRNKTRLALYRGDICNDCKASLKIA